MDDVLNLVGKFLTMWCSQVVCCTVGYRLHAGHKGMALSWPELLGCSAVAGFFLTWICLAIVVPLQLLWGTHERGLIADSLASFRSAAPAVLIIWAPFAILVITWVYELDNWMAGVSVFFLSFTPAVVIFAAVVGWSLLHAAIVGHY